MRNRKRPQLRHVRWPYWWHIAFLLHVGIAIHVTITLDVTASVLVGLA